MFVHRNSKNSSFIPASFLLEHSLCGWLSTAAEDECYNAALVRTLKRGLNSGSLHIYFLGANDGEHWNRVNNSCFQHFKFHFWEYDPLDWYGMIWVFEWYFLLILLFGSTKLAPTFRLHELNFVGLTATSKNHGCTWHSGYEREQSIILESGFLVCHKPWTSTKFSDFEISKKNSEELENLKTGSKVVAATSY